MNSAWQKDLTEEGSLSGLVGGFEQAGQLQIRTLEGMMLVGWADYIIQGIQGELYPCKEDIFEATYDAVGEDQPDEKTTESP